MKEEHMNKASRKLSPELANELKALEATSDDDINLSDIPEVADWSGAVRGKFYRPVKQQVTLRLDADVLDWFKRQARDERGYQTRINAALRQLMDRAQRKSA
jgi:uncharacterized protein (DUF4415 family)